MPSADTAEHCGLIVRVRRGLQQRVAKGTHRNDRQQQDVPVARRKADRRDDEVQSDEEEAEEKTLVIREDVNP